MMSRRPAQIFQYTAIVTAGMASIALTVAAGTYVVNQIAETGRMPGTEIALPGTGLTDQGPVHEPRTYESSVTPRVSAEIDLMADSERLPGTPYDRKPPAPAGHPAPSVASATGTPETVPAPMRVQLPGDTYVGADVARPQPNSLTMTVDTNLVAAVTTALARQLGDRPDAVDPAGVTRISTDVDIHSGEVTLAFSDPMFGRQSVQLLRRTV
ncbi:hypothetical protein [Nocardia sp. NPDC051570]|uniref:hypothetical protein n=1 Tax=Nocardia sp. NPDC051570 TaxID=3364324 RepID=UPI0037B17019